MSTFSNMNSMMFSILPVVVTIGFILVFGVIILTIIKSAAQWNKNNKSPVLTIAAKVVTKRTALHAHAANDMNAHASTTTFYVTFEVPSGDRVELRVPGSEYGLLADGDFGTLTFQGTRFVGYERKPQA